jgi:F0F1-type ATP synthase assembly protein I
LRPSQNTSSSSLSIGLSWASRITALGLEFALPALAGHWIDGRLGTSPWVTLLGCVLGITAGFVHLMQIAREGAVKNPKPNSPHDREQT